MDRPIHPGTAAPSARIGLLACSLMGLVVAAWIAGWAWLAIPAALAAIGVSAIAAGVDSRAPGDWPPGS
jgi:hypothetical protein